MAFNVKYSVESYQVAIPGGDCSIHLLLSNPPENQATFTQDLQGSEKANAVFYRKIGSAKPEKTEIVSAVLVDGGYDGAGGTFKGKDACVSIKEAVTDIEQRYGVKLKFDAWVVTHWDRDHFCGTLQWIVNDLSEQYRKDRKVKEEKDPSRHRFTYFKYDDATGECMTTLYCPVYDRTEYITEYRLKKKLSATAKLSETDEDKIPKGRHWRLGKNAKGDHVEVVMVKNSSTSIYTGISARSYKELDWLPGICKLVERFENLWGMNVFTGLPINKTPLEGRSDAQGGTDVTIKDVMGQLKDDKMPVFLIVGAEGYIMGEKKEMKNLREPVGETLENFISIVSLIVWPPSAENGKKGRVSYFNGGDTDKNTEERLAKWMAGTTVRVFKTSHHGAYTATPPAVLKKLQPDKVLISAGFEYGHPSWVVLTVLFAYWADMVTNNKITEGQGRDMEGLVFPLRYPYYLEGYKYNKKGSQVELITKDFNVNLKVKWQDSFNILTQGAGKVSERRTEILKKPYAQEGKTFREWAPADARDFGKGITWDTLTEAGNQFVGNQPWAKFHPRGASPEPFLFLTILAEYWLYISKVQGNWGQQHNKNPDVRKAVYLWTRSCDHDGLDGRVEIIDNWLNYVDARNTQLKMYRTHAQNNQNANMKMDGVQGMKPSIAPATGQSSDEADLNVPVMTDLEPDIVFLDKNWTVGAEEEQADLLDKSKNKVIVIQEEDEARPNSMVMKLEEDYLTIPDDAEVEMGDHPTTSAGPATTEFPMREELTAGGQHHAAGDDHEATGHQTQPAATGHGEELADPRAAPTRDEELAALKLRLAVVEHKMRVTQQQLLTNSLQMIFLQDQNIWGT
ncbi:hypothetical protein ASPZODRAFT_20802 [Penicilliopsis zonata CBS 506.65]|uniref:Metallo-beta-lactamase domain-containing protein n=1 Tax=Penicilliopsis zonata CBS 506.65 TaxID=1073090 RepID=A0A1L9S4J0_9EURO|nr:hypothetical protein ASPZODRAFT_20802 [Penicilliopsis zonata CBS 506.65]OJJ42076.1 hypothetical protein ASPZODRAFT_20802 [Penicilliopsis zonata CBS 506.65]